MDAVVKLVDVAAAAGVSVATVSRVLNKNPAVDPELAARVRAASDRLGYRPNAVARNLRRQDTRAWQLVLSDVTNPFYTGVAVGVEDVATANGYSVLLGNSAEDEARERHYLEVAEEERVAGVIIAPQSPDSPVASLMATGTPLVAVNQTLAAPVDTVLVDGRSGAEEATAHLLGHGWRRPACISGPLAAETARSRVEGYRSVITDRGLDALVTHESYDRDGGVAGAESLLAATDPPDAFFCANALLALGLLEVLQARGLRAGQDVGLIAFDDTPWSAVLDPPMSVVAQHPYEIGRRAATLLLERIRGKDDDVETEPRTEVLSTTLVERRSCQRPD